jgi:NADPH:quinone reductase-like Zn-dependent oxidoreductase
VQLAKWKGAYVIGTASAKNRDYLLKLGADEVIDYTVQPFENAVSEVNMVLDTIGGDTQRRSWQTLKKGGILVSTVQSPPAEEAASRGVRRALVMVQTNPANLEMLTRLVDLRELKVPVTAVLPLSEARKALEMSQARHTQGKIILKVV